MSDDDLKAALARLQGSFSAALKHLTELVNDHHAESIRFQEESRRDRRAMGERLARIEARSERAQTPTHSGPRTKTVVTGGAVIAAACLAAGTALGPVILEAFMEAFK